MARSDVYFASDVHLGLRIGDPAEREARFVAFLKSIPHDRTRALYLLGDIWDFWFEYRDVVPRCGAKVIAALVELMDAGVEVWFCAGNHDLWTFSFLQELGMKKFMQPHYVEFGGKVFCLGHGDMLGGAKRGYRLMMKLFNSRFLQGLFGVLHPRLAFGIGLGWSERNRKSRHQVYHFRGKDEPLYGFALEASRSRRVDYFVFGHFHDAVDMTLPGGSRLVVLKDWIGGGVPYACFNGSSFELHSPECGPL